MIEIEYDEAANAAYIRIARTVGPGDVSFTYPCDPVDVGGMINLDFDEAGRLIGIEVLDARAKLDQALLEESTGSPGSAWRPESDA